MTYTSPLIPASRFDAVMVALVVATVVALVSAGTPTLLQTCTVHKRDEYRTLKNRIDRLSTTHEVNSGVGVGLRVGPTVRFPVQILYSPVSGADS